MKTITLITFLIVIISCKKNKPVVNSCNGATMPVAEFYTQEILTDTAFNADTIYKDNYVNFITNYNYNTVLWKVGNDPRDFTTKDFSLVFYNYMGTIPVNFTGKATPNTLCFPNDNGTYLGSKQLTLVEQFDRNTLTLSPLIGIYKGSFTDNTSFIFSTEVKYYDSLKYISTTGRENFYYINNFPYGFRDTTSNAGIIYKELSYGLEIEMGYKCAQFGYGGILDGKNFAELKTDTLIINSNINGVRKKFIAKRI